MVYFIRGNTLRNNASTDYNKMIEAGYKKRWGDNWQKGAEKDGYINHKEGSEYAKEQRQKMEKERNEVMKESMKKSVEELAIKKSISGMQAQRLVNVADQL